MHCKGLLWFHNIHHYHSHSYSTSPQDVPLSIITEEVEVAVHLSLFCMRFWIDSSYPTVDVASPFILFSPIGIRHPITLHPAYCKKYHSFEADCRVLAWLTHVLTQLMPRVFIHHVPQHLSFVYGTGVNESKPAYAGVSMLHGGFVGYSHTAAATGWSKVGDCHLTGS